MELLQEAHPVVEWSLALGLPSVPFLALWAWSSSFHSLNFLLSITKWFAISSVQVLFYYFICKAEISVLLTTALSNLRHLELCVRLVEDTEWGFLNQVSLIFPLPHLSPLVPRAHLTPEWVPHDPGWKVWDPIGIQVIFWFQPWKHWASVPVCGPCGFLPKGSKASFQKAGDGLHEIHHHFLLLECFLSPYCVPDLLLNMEVSRKHWDSGSVLRS